MARGKAVDLSTRSFSNQKLATEFFREMLGRYKPRQRVNDEDSLDLSALLERHDEYPKKVGIGIDHFEVMTTEHGTNCFRIVRKDGSGTDFSFGHCITKRAPALKKEVSDAFRRAVRIDLYKARDSFLKSHTGADGMVECAVSRERILPEQGHMDHRPPLTFEVIVTTFLGGRGLSLDQVPITSGRDEQTTTEITDPKLAEEFKNYHNSLAKLDFVKDQINLSQASKHRIKQSRISLGD